MALCIYFSSAVFISFRKAFAWFEETQINFLRAIENIFPMKLSRFECCRERLPSFAVERSNLKASASQFMHEAAAYLSAFPFRFICSLAR